MRYKDAALPVAARVEDLLAQMTLAEKVAQLTQVFVTPQTRQQVIERIRQTGIGSRILAESNLAGNIPQRIAEMDDLNALQRVAVEESRLGIPLLHGRDVIHGHRTTFPIPLAMAAGFDPQAVEEAFAIAGHESASAGVHWSFAPMLDIARDPRWGRVIEGFGEDPYLASQMAAAAVRGFQDRGGILACAKHYIGYGAAEGGRDYNTAEISDNTLRNTYLPPFKAAVAAGVGSVMSAFNDLNGESASGSHYLLTEILRGELGFEGFVVSDWGSVADLMTHRVASDEREAAEKAFFAGVDMEMVSECYPHHLAELVEQLIVPQELIDASVRRVLAAKLRLGLFEHPYVEKENFTKEQFTPQNELAARRLAARSMVLLKNDGLLPLQRGGQRIAVIGPYADQRRALLGSWVNDGLVEETATLAEAMRLAFPQDEILSVASGLYDEMLMAAARADVVILALGESNQRNGEFNSVAELRLPAGQEELAAAVAALGKPFVVVVFAGRPLVLTHLLPEANALLYAWHPGSLGAAAVSDLLSGTQAPSGKLPITFPRATGQVPIYYNHKSTGKGEGKYRDLPAEPLFPFGFGLSYTTFEYSDLAVAPKTGGEVGVSAMVKNTGQCAGDEVVQCYIQDCVAELTRPVRELKGFRRVSLQPGEERRVEFFLGAEELSYYGRGGKWVLEPGEFKVWVGADSNAALEGAFRVEPARPG